MSAFETVKNVRVGLSSVRAPGWRKTWSRRAAMLAFAGGGATSFGCGSVAGPEYTGEVGLELRGEVVSFDGASDDRVPVLAFIGQGWKSYHLLDGDVEGQFPSQFVYRVDEPPPEGAMLEIDGPPNGVKGAVAFLVMAPTDHPTVIETDDDLLWYPAVDESSEPDPETGIFTRTLTKCSADQKQCETSIFSCEPEPCEPVLVAGRAAPYSIGEGSECFGSACLTYLQTCDENACSTAFAFCKDRGVTDDVSSDGVITRCTLQSTDGEQPTNSVSGMIANDLLVYFMTEDVSKDGLELKQGYNLVQIVSDKDAWAESLLCRLEAEEEVRSQAGDYPESELTERIIEAQDRCPEAQRYDVVENPGDKKLSISLGNPSAI